MSAACAALPCLSEAELKRAVSAAVATREGEPLPASAQVALVAELRKAWRQLTASAESAHPGGGTDRSPLILLLDARIGALPWESMPLLREAAVCRLPCAAFLGSSLSAAQRLTSAESTEGLHSSRAYYVLNPGGDLARTQNTFESSFAKPPWEGVSGAPPPVETLATALREKNLYVYCGHGDGGKYLPAETLQRLPHCSAAFLMGCSSGALRSHGGLAPSGMAIAYLHAHCPALVANLWDVTDGEIDRFCAALLKHTTEEGGSLLAAVAKARTACRLRFLTGAAAVTYGVPLDFLPRE
jgi:separase